VDYELVGLIAMGFSYILVMLAALVAMALASVDSR
jgi:hypothetical protein